MLGSHGYFDTIVNSKVAHCENPLGFGLLPESNSKRLLSFVPTVSRGGSVTKGSSRRDIVI